MKKLNKVGIIEYILYMVIVALMSYLGCIALTRPISYARDPIPAESSYESLEVVEIQAAEKPSETPEPIPTVSVEPFEVAEPLQGKDLYIFQLSQICEQYYPDVDPYIALAVMEIESNYNPNVQSSAGAVGLMQVIPKYHARRVAKYGLTDIWDPYTNIIAGVDFLNELYQTYGSWSRALLGYNNSTQYVNYVLAKADSLRGGNIFGEKKTP